MVRFLLPDIPERLFSGLPFPGNESVDVLDGLSFVIAIARKLFRAHLNNEVKELYFPAEFFAKGLHIFDFLGKLFGWGLYFLDTFLVGGELFLEELFLGLTIEVLEAIDFFLLSLIFVGELVDDIGDVVFISIDML
jgi:hypothetical protein